jgi:hypothetical protein
MSKIPDPTRPRQFPYPVRIGDGESFERRGLRVSFKRECLAKDCCDGSHWRRWRGAALRCMCTASSNVPSWLLCVRRSALPEALEDAEQVFVPSPSGQLCPDAAFARRIGT